jgi:hypothetical protein
MDKRKAAYVSWLLDRLSDPSPVGAAEERIATTDSAVAPQPDDKVNWRTQPVKEWVPRSRQMCPWDSDAIKS